jgi:hypothetical protein
MRISKSFTIEPEVSEYVMKTKGEQSASERVNDLLRRAMLEEKYERLEAEAAAFFGVVGAKERKETQAYQRAAIRTFQRD